MLNPIDQNAIPVSVSKWQSFVEKYFPLPNLDFYDAYSKSEIVNSFVSLSPVQLNTRLKLVVIESFV